MKKYTLKYNLFKILLTLSATSWMVVLYGLKAEWTISSLPPICFSLLFISLPIILSLISLYWSHVLSVDTMREFKDLRLADADFLPIYLGYFFVALSVPNAVTFCFVYALVFLFTFLSQAQYFNPIFLLFGYHYYHVTTKNDTKIFIIKQGKIIRSMRDISEIKLHRINDTTYIVLQSHPKKNVEDDIDDEGYADD